MEVWLQTFLNTEVWPGPGFLFGHITPSQGEISSCLDAESAEILGISTGLFLFCFVLLPLRTLKKAQIFLQLWPVVLMSSQMRCPTGDCQVPWEISVTLTIGPERRELRRELPPIMLISCGILEGLTSKGLSYQSATHKGARKGEECNENI